MRGTKGTLMTGWMWTLITILGPLLLIAAVVWAYLRNRNPSREEIARAERGARELREELEEEEARRGEP
jgi:cbb3-type cytochrome oxidase subunit 3